jgi:hypothetical protein
LFTRDLHIILKERHMFRSTTIALLGALGLSFPLAASAGVVPPTPAISVVAEVVCGPTGAVVNFTVSGNSGPNANVDVFFNNVKVFDGAFVGQPLDLQFSGSAPAPSGGSVSVRAEAIGDWDYLGAGSGGQSATTSVTVPERCSSGGGRFTGGGRQLVVDRDKVTRGLTIHCDLRLSNNLEINWGGRNHFHMTQHLSAQCFDSELIDQRPPNAPLDTLIGVGRGRFNGVDGYTVEFTLVDAGEPGRDDMMAIRIFETANPSNVVLNVPLRLLDDGNLQAHYDQPHRTR